MAKLTADEFGRLVEILVEGHGLGAVQQALARTNTLVSRRSARSPRALAHHLYQMTIGLSREGRATEVVLGLWERHLGSRLEEDDGKTLEALAERVNACLGDRQQIVEDKRDALEKALGEYHAKLTEVVGDETARLTMITRAVPDVAPIVRAIPCPS